MKVLVKTHAQMFSTPDGSVWTNSVYDYSFFKRYLAVFSEVRVVTRMKEIGPDEVGNKIRVDGEGLEFYSLPFYRGPWQFLLKSIKTQSNLSHAVNGCHCAILRIPDQVSFQIFNKLQKANIPCAVEVVAHSWDLYAPGTINTILRPLLRILWDYLQKKACRNADGVAYVTDAYIQKRYPAKIDSDDGRRFQTCYTSADLDSRFFYRPRTIDDFSTEPFLAVHVSNINDNAKGHFELLHAVYELKKRSICLKVIFVGGGTLLDYFRGLSGELGLPDQVTFCGNISNMEDVIRILREADIFIFPSMSEGLPRVILEAMAAGLPCIASNVGGTPELLSERSLIRPNHVDDLCDKILEFIQDKELLVEESTHNFTNAQGFSSQAIQFKRNEFYYKLMNCAKKRIAEGIV